MAKFVPVGDHAGNYSSSAESRKSGYTKPSNPAPAKKSIANNGPVKYAGAKSTPSKAPTPTARPNYTPGSDAQYSTYSTSGATQSGKGSTFGSSGSSTRGGANPVKSQNVGGFAANTRSKSDLNNFKQSESRYSSDQSQGKVSTSKSNFFRIPSRQEVSNTLNNTFVKKKYKAF